MDYTAYISTPANTPATAPLITPLHLTRGTITGGFLYFPPGPSGLLHFIALIGQHQICPAGTGQSYRLDDCIAPLDISLALHEPPYIIDCVTWNDSTLYAHALTVSFFLHTKNGPRSMKNAIKDLLTNATGYHKP